MTHEGVLSAIMHRKDELDAQGKPYEGDTILAAWRRTEAKVSRLLDEKALLRICWVSLEPKRG